MTDTPTRNARSLGHSKEQARVSRARTSLYELEADAIKALAHPKRLLVLDLLSDGKERTVTELLVDTGMSQSNLSQNLAVMRTGGLVVGRREGNSVYYRVADPRVVKAVVLMRSAMEEIAKDRQFLLERAALARKDAVRRAATYCVAFVAAGVALALAGAITHPVLAGLPLGDVSMHVERLATSGSPEALWATCMDLVVDEGAQGSGTTSSARMPPSEPAAGVMGMAS